MLTRVAGLFAARGFNIDSLAVGPTNDDGLSRMTVVVQVDRRRKRLEQWGTTLVPAGSELTITNATPEPAVVLLVAAPPPTKRAVSE